ncbi:MAG: DUF6049 family protein [Nocardioidaceae bacterium]
MTRPVLQRAAACLLTGLLGALAPAVAPALTPGLAAPAHADETSPAATPLKVSIQTLSPSTVPGRGRVTVTGTITNRSDNTWTGLHVYMLTSHSPITTSDALAQAGASDPATVVGSRLIGNGLFDKVPDLPPGGSTGYRLSVPRQDLGITGQPGVYWLGVHVLGADPAGQDSVADGRARTFIPLMKPNGPSTSLSLVMPLKAPVRRDRTGQLADPQNLERAIASDGRLDRLLQLSGTAHQALTWEVDPAMLDAVQSVARGNPPLDTGPTAQSQGSSTSPSPTPSPSSSPSPSASANAGAGSSGAAASGSPEHRAAVAWTSALQQQASSHAVMAVPYGDLDVASALTDGYRGLFRKAVGLSSQTMAGLGVRSSPLVAPPSGYLPGRALHRLPKDSSVLLADQAFPSAATTVVRVASGGGESSVGLTDTAAGSGGPSPGRRFSALAVRQRILSDAALHALSPARDQPMVVSTPQFWNPGASWRDARFFHGLTVPWLNMVDLPALLSTTGAGSTPPATDPPVYPPEQHKIQVPVANLQASRALARTGRVLDSLLARNDTVDADLGKQALLASSTRVRHRPGAAVRRANAAALGYQREMRKVSIDGPSFVTMSSGSGTFSVTVVNGLDETVSVAVAANTGSAQVKIPPSEPVTLGPGERASVRLQATSTGIGVHPVSLVPVNADGQSLGTVTQFSLRSSQVGLVIWVIMGIGAAVLVVAIAIRVRRRVSRRRQTHGPLLKGTT